MARIDFALSAAQRVDAREALRILGESGISLTEAARRAVVGRLAVKRVTLAEAADLFVRDRLLSGLRQASVDWYEAKLSATIARFGEKTMDDLSRGELVPWIRSLPVGDNTKAARLRALRALYRWAMAQEPALAGSDPTAGQRTSSKRTADAGEIAFLNVEECAAIMAGAGPYRSALALMLFAGVRPGEIRYPNKPALCWQHVLREQKLIRIPSTISKTGRRGTARQIQGAPPALWAWLDSGEAADPICPALAQQAVERAQKLAGYSAARRWPADALRHTFATYHVNAYGSAAKTALLLGHEGNVTMLHRHYMGLATKPQAVAFWALRPS